jgi:hypothetical protein
MHWATPRRPGSTGTGLFSRWKSAAGRSATNARRVSKHLTARTRRSAADDRAAEHPEPVIAGHESGGIVVALGCAVDAGERAQLLDKHVDGNGVFRCKAGRAYYGTLHRSVRHRVFCFSPHPEEHREAVRLEGRGPDADSRICPGLVVRDALLRSVTQGSSP